MSVEVIYIYQLHIFPIFNFIDRVDKEITTNSQIRKHMEDKSYIYIFTVTYLAYILFLIECVDYPPPLNTERYWYPFQDLIMELSHTLT